MPEYRRDPITGRTVIIAAERAARPHHFDIEVNDGESPQPLCPFCEGNENQTTDEVAAFRNENSLPNTSGWQVRTVSNMYPAVSQHCAAGSSAEYPVPSPGCGQHEVIIDTPRHILSVSEMTEQEVFLMFQMYQERIKYFRNKKRWRFVQIFKNVGAAAGASIPHSHSQLIALPFVPQAVPQPQNDSCPYCALLESELNIKSRIVEDTGRSVALCPFASRFAGEVEVYPKRHCASFEMLTEEELQDFALLVQRIIVRLEQKVAQLTGRLAYNLVLHTEPLDNANTAAFHTYLSVLPSLARAAGFEWGTGLHINPFPPEHTAELLRE